MPESVVRDAESNLERYLTNHSQQFWDDLGEAIGKAIDENHAELVCAGAVGEDEEDEEAREEQEMEISLPG